MKTRKKNHKKTSWTAWFRREAPVSFAIFIFLANTALANPYGPQVVSGSAQFNTAGNTLNITNSPNAIINWQGFSIQQNELTRFIQQNPTSAVLNRVIGQDPSAILGALQSNGRVFLINPNGVLFGQGARIEVNGLIVSTLNLSNTDFLSGKYNFTAGVAAGGIQNQGSITTPAGGQVYLIAPNVENTGIINSPQGDVILAAGHSVQLVDSVNPDIAVVISAPENKAVNLGQIIATSGRVGIYGGLIQQSGTVRADSAVAGENGKIFFKATKDIALDTQSTTSATGVKGGEITIQSQEGNSRIAGSITASGSSLEGGDIKILGQTVELTDQALLNASGPTGGGTILAGGDYQGANPEIQNAQMSSVGRNVTIKADALTKGDGGKVVVWSDEKTVFSGSISARGGQTGGDGGQVETSGSQLKIEDTARVDTRAPAGKTGNWLLDPTDYIVAASGGDISGATLSGNLASNNVTILSTQGQIQGFGDIKISDSVSWTSAHSLTLNADRNIDLNANVSSSNGALYLNHGAGGAVNLQSGTLTLGVNTTVANMNLSGGTLTGSGKLITTGATEITGAPSLNAKVWDNTGTIDISGSGRLVYTNSATLNNTGTVNLKGTQNYPMTYSNGGNIFNNTGILNKTTATDQTLSIGGTIDNSGTFNLGANTGKLTLNNGGTYTGNFIVGSGSFLELDGGTYNWDKQQGSLFTGTGQVRFLSGTINVNEAQTMTDTGPSFYMSGGQLKGTDAGDHLTLQNSFTLAGGTLTGSGKLITAGATEITGAPSLNAKVWDNTGTIDISGSGRLVYTNSATLNNTGTINLLGTNNYPMTYSNGGNIFNNTGILNKTTATDQTLSIGGTIDNSGTFNIQNKILEVNDAISTSGGTISVASGTTFKKSGGFTNDGTIKGSGTIDVGVGNTLTNAGTLSPGSSAGTLSITGNLTNTGILEIEMGGKTSGSYDVLSVSGNVSLGGTLNASLIGGYTPSNNDYIPFLLAVGSRSGTFSTVNAPPFFEAGYSLASGEAARLIYNLSGANTFTNALDDLKWEKPGNWSYSIIPVSSHNVLISAGHAVSHGTGTDTIASLTVNTSNSLTISGGSLTVLGETVVGGALTVSGGTLLLQGTSNIANFSLSSGTLGGVGNAYLNGISTWTGGTISLGGGGGVTVAAGKTLSLSGTGNKYLSGGNLNVAGTMDWLGTGNLYFNEGSQFTILSGGLFDIRTDSNIYYSTGAKPTFTNAGILAKSGGTGETVIGSNAAINFINSGGSIQETSAGSLKLNAAASFSGNSEITGGTVKISSGGGSVTGTVDIGDGAILDFQSGTTSFTGTTNITGKGTLLLSGATFGGSGILNVGTPMGWTGGTISAGGSGGVTVATGKTLSLSGTGNKYLSGGNLTVAGTMDWVGTGNLYLNEGSQLTIPSGGLFDIKTDSDIFYTTGVTKPTFTNFGTLQKSVETGETVIGANASFNFVNSGAIVAQTGILNFKTINTFNNGSTFTGAGKSLITTGASFSGTINSNTNLELVGGTFTGTATFSGDTAWSGGTLGNQAAYTIPFGSTLRLTNTSNINMNKASLIGAGTILWTGAGHLYFNDESQLTIPSGGLFDIKTDADIYYTDGAKPTFSNSGILRKSGGAGETVIGSNAAINFINSGGSIQETSAGSLKLNAAASFSGNSEITGGTVKISSGGGSVTGTVDIGDGATLDFQSGTTSFTGTTNITGKGTLLLSGATFGGSGILNVGTPMGWTGGTISAGGSGGVTVATGKTLSLSGTGNKYLSGGNLTVAGTMDWVGTGNLYLNEGSQLTIPSGGLFDIKTDSDIFYTTGVTKPTFTNFGTLQKSVETGETVIGANASFNFVNSGAIVAQTGILNFKTINTFNNGSTFTGAGKSLITTGASFSGTINSNTNLELVGGTFTGTAVLSGSTKWSGGTIGSTADYTVPVNSTLELAENTNKTIDGGKLTIADGGTMNWLDGYLYMKNSSQLNVQGGGLLDIQTDKNIIGDNIAPSSVLTNAGTLQKSAGAGETVIGYLNPVSVVNSGKVDVKTGVLKFSGVNTFNNGSTFTGAGTSLVTSGGVFSGNISSANLNLSSGVFTGTATLSGITTWTGGSIGSAGNFTVPLNSNLYLAGTSSKTIDGGKLTIADGGTMRWLDGYLYMNNSSQLNVQGGGLLDIQTDKNIIGDNIAPSSVLTNAGTLQKSAGAGETVIGYLDPVSVVNSGKVDVKTGIINVNGLFSTSGTIAVAAGTTFKKTGGFSNYGTISGNGAINVGAGKTLINSGTLSPGASAGTLSITGNLTLADTGTLNIELGGTSAGQYDVLAVSGTATLGGTLNVNEIDGFMTKSSDTFTVLTAGTRSGNFATTNYPADVLLTATTTGNLMLTANSVVTRWNTDSSGDWTTAGNWTRGIPGAGDTVFINRLSADPTVTVSTGSQTAGYLTCDDNLSIAGGTLSLGGTSSIANFSISSGSLNGAGTLAVTNSYQQSGGSVALGGNFSAFQSTGVMNVGNLSGNNVALTANNGGIILTGPVSATGSGDALIVRTDKFTNNYGASALTAPNGRWLIYSANPLEDSRNGLAYNFKQYNTTYGGTVQGAGNGFIYTIAPVLTPGLTGEARKTYDGTDAATLAAGNYTASGAIDGDTILLNNPSAGTYDTKHVAAGKAVTVTGISLVSAKEGAATVYGYGLSSNTATANIGVITPASLTITASTNTKTYDGTTSAAALPTFTGLFAGDSLTGLVEAYDTKNAGTGKTLTVTGYTLNDGNSGNNYNVTTINDTTGVINKAPLTFTADDKNRTYGDPNPMLTGTFTGFAGGETLATSGVTGSANFETEAIVSSNVGTYDIIPDAGTLSAGNYSFSYFEKGQLLINKASLSVIADDKSKISGEQNPLFTASYRGFKLGQNETALSGNLAFYTPATASSPQGNYAITPSGQTSGNYEIAFVDGNLTVLPGKAVEKENNALIVAQTEANKSKEAVISFDKEPTDEKGKDKDKDKDKDKNDTQTKKEGQDADKKTEKLPYCN